MVGPRSWMLAALLTLTACDSPGGWSSRPPLPDGAAPTTSPAPVTTERVYYLANVSGKCSVYWLRGEQRSATHAEICPREVAPGERIRLAGRVCFRESTAFDRALPVRCPKTLLYAERDGRAGKGERALPVASSATKTTTR